MASSCFDKCQRQHHLQSLARAYFDSPRPHMTGDLLGLRPFKRCSDRTSAALAPANNAHDACLTVDPYWRQRLAGSGFSGEKSGPDVYGVQQ